MIATMIGIDRRLVRPTATSPTDAPTMANGVSWWLAELKKAIATTTRSMPMRDTTGPIGFRISSTKTWRGSRVRSISRATQSPGPGVRLKSQAMSARNQTYMIMFRPCGER